MKAAVWLEQLSAGSGELGGDSPLTLKVRLLLSQATEAEGAGLPADLMVRAEGE